MRPLTDDDRKKILAAGELCYNKLLEEIEQDSPEGLDYDREKLCAAEAKAWRELYWKERRGIYKRWGITVACVMLVLVAVMLLGKPTVAYQVWQNSFFAKEDSNSMSIVSSSTVLLPENWTGCYLPTKVPLEYSIDEAQALEFTQSIFYTGENGRYIMFSATLDDYNVHLDTEDCSVEDVQVKDSTGKLIIKYKDDQVAYRTICWIENGVLFDITSNDLSSESLLNVAESVMIAE